MAPRDKAKAAGVSASSFLDLKAELVKQEGEFKSGSIGLADSAGILAASLLAVPTEVGLCHAQVARGKVFCQSL